MLSHKTFQSLEGSWQLERFVNEEPVMKGRCFFSKRTPSLFLYREEVTWHHGLEGFREYFYSWEGKGLKLYFPEKGEPGALFLDLKEKNGSYMGTHPCKADIYEASFLFSPPDHMRVKFKVTGPHKSMIIRSEMNRD